MGYYWLPGRNRCGWVVKVERKNVADDHIAVYSNRHSPGRYHTVTTSKPHWIDYKGGGTELFGGDNKEDSSNKNRIAEQKLADELSPSPAPEADSMFLKLLRVLRKDVM